MQRSDGALWSVLCAASLPSHIALPVLELLIILFFVAEPGRATENPFAPLYAAYFLIDQGLDHLGLFNLSRSSHKGSDLQSTSVPK